MIIKHFRFTVALLALGTMGLMTESAGQVVLRKVEPAKITAATYIACTVTQKLLQQGPPETQLTITANPRSGIPKGTTIYWKVGDPHKGSFNLPNDLRPTMSFSTRIHMDSAVADAVKAMAWYYK
jgi:hypothetical protein